MLIPESLEAIERIRSDLFMVEVGEFEIVFTLPPRLKAQQYDQLLTLAANDYGLQSVIYEHIFTTYVESKFIAEHGYDIPAGIPQTIAELILYLSGLGNTGIDYTNDLLDIYRKNKTVINHMKASICRTFHGYKFADLDVLNYQELIEIYVEAEQILIEADIIKDELILRHPEEKQQSQKLDIEKLIAQDALEYGKFNMKQETPMIPKQKLQEKPKAKNQVRLAKPRRHKNKNGG